MPWAGEGSRGRRGKKSKKGLAGATTGKPFFCSVCSELHLSKANHNINNDAEGYPRCERCAYEARMAAAVGASSPPPTSQWLRQSSDVIDTTVAPPVIFQDAAAPAAEHPRTPNSAALVALEEAPEALQEAILKPEADDSVAWLLVLLRRENRELRRRLREAQLPQGALPEPAALPAEPEALVLLAGEIDALPRDHRSTASIKELVDILREGWRVQARGNSAMGAAVLGAEATSATLQEELVMFEMEQVTLSQLVKAQAAEIDQLHATMRKLEGEAYHARQSAGLASVGKAEA